MNTAILDHGCQDELVVPFNMVAMMGINSSGLRKVSDKVKREILIFTISVAKAWSVWSGLGAPSLEDPETSPGFFQGESCAKATGWFNRFLRQL